MRLVPGHRFACHLVQVDVFGELRVECAKDLLYRRFHREKLPSEILIAEVTARATGLFVASDQVHELLKSFPHPVPVHGPTLDSRGWRHRCGSRPHRPYRPTNPRRSEGPLKAT